MKTPIEILLDRIDWAKTEGVGESGLPYETHRSILQIGNIELECVQLSNGQRVFTEESLERAMPGWREMLDPKKREEAT